MRLEKISFRKLQLPFRHPFTISGGRTKTHQPVFQVSITHGGLTGYGEAPEISYYGISLDQMASALENIRPLLEKVNMRHPELFFNLLLTYLPDNSFLRCALDMAAWDLYAKQMNKPVHACWGIPYNNLIQTDFTIGIGGITEMLERMNENPWPVYKIKMGFEHDMDVLRELRKHTRQPLRIDVNGGWSYEIARMNLPFLEKLNIELLEQPLHKSDWLNSNRLFSEAGIPVFADESCVSEEDVQACSGFFHGINIKLTKCGGITPALRMIRKARQLGLKVMMGSMNESSIGSAAIAHFLPQLDYVDMDGPLLLARDTAAGLQISQGEVNLSGNPGLGVQPYEPF